MEKNRRLKILNLNMWDGGRLMDNILTFIREEDPDIVTLQEVYDGHESSWSPQYRTVDILRKEFQQLEYAHFAPALLEVLEFGKIDQGNAIFSKYPITQTRITFYDRPFRERKWDVVTEAERLDRNYTTPRNLQHVTVSVNGVDINVFNTQGIWGEDGADNDRRLAMANIIANSVQGKQNVILCGDFNFQLADTNALRIMEEQGRLRSLFKGELSCTFNMQHKDSPGYATAVVDGIFVSPSLQVLEHSMPDKDVSDHMPLIATIEI